MLQAFGFLTCWVNRIMLCVESMKYFITVNNNLVGPIVPQRGFRQGDPLSPYLFIICMEGLSAYINHEEAIDRIHGFSAKRAPTISHFFFADDVFLFCRASVDEICHVKAILTAYEAALGLGINNTKFGIMGSRNLAADLMHGFSYILGIDKPINTGRYLGLLSLVGRSKKNIFRHIQERICKCLYRWGKRPISSAGKAILIKAATQPIPVYYMNVFLPLVATIK